MNSMKYETKYEIIGNYANFSFNVSKASEVARPFTVVWTIDMWLSWHHMHSYRLLLREALPNADNTSQILSMAVNILMFLMLSLADNIWKYLITEPIS